MRDEKAAIIVNDTDRLKHYLTYFQVLNFVFWALAACKIWITYNPIVGFEILLPLISSLFPALLCRIAGQIYIEGLISGKSRRFAETIREYPEDQRALNQIIFDGDAIALCVKYNAEQVLRIINNIPGQNQNLPPKLLCLENWQAFKGIHSRSPLIFKLNLFEHYKNIYQLITEILNHAKLPVDILSEILKYISFDEEAKHTIKKQLQDSYEFMETQGWSGEVWEIEPRFLTPLRANKTQMLQNFDSIMNRIDQDYKQDCIDSLYKNHNGRPINTHKLKIH